MPFKIRTKLLSAFFAIILPSIANGAILVLYSADTIHKSVHKVRSIAEERAVITNLILTMEEALMPGNDYIITGNKKYIDDFYKVSDEVEKRMKEAKGIVHDAVEERKILDDTNIAWQGIKEIFLKIFAISNPAGNRDAAMLMEEMDYKWAYPAIKRLKELREAHIEEFQKAAKTADKVWIHSWIIMISGSFVFTAFGIFFAFFYSKRFSGPIEVIHNGADAIANGNFKTRMDIKTGDEIEQLSNAMNEMAAQLDSLYSNLQGMVEERTRELRDSEERYHFLFNKMLNGFALHEIICDEAGKPVDYRFLEVNQAFEKLTGLRSNDIIGKTVLQVLPDTEQYWIDTYGRVALTGESVHLENYSKELDKYYEVTAYSHKKGFFAVIFADVTERKKTEAVFRALAVSNIGAEFFHETVSSLCTWIGVECAIVGELVDGGRVRALAMQLDGKAVEHYEYALAGTPCESATQKGYCEYHEGVVQLFPADKDLVDMRAEAYIGTPIRDKNGKVNGILCAISRHKFVPPPMVREVFEIIAARAGTEIERKRTEETLRVSEEMYRSLFDNMLNGFAYCRMLFESGQPQDFIYLSVNHSFEALTGLKGVVGKKVTEVIPGIREADPGLFEIYGRVALSGNPERFEMYVESLRMWFWISVYSPHKEHFVAVFDVITERKMAEEALKESEERFRTITNTAGDAIICLEVPGNIKIWNKKAEEMFGYPADEVGGRDLHDLIVPETYREKAREGLKGFFQTGAGAVVDKTVELTALRKDGTEFPIALSISAMKIQGEWQATGIIRDITERKRAEDELAKHVDELERYMKATVQREFRIKELRDRVQELEKRLKG